MTSNKSQIACFDKIFGLYYVSALQGNKDRNNAFSGHKGHQMSNL